MGAKTDITDYQGIANVAYTNGKNEAKLWIEVNFQNSQPEGVLVFEADIENSTTADWGALKVQADFVVSPDSIGDSGSVQITKVPKVDGDYLLSLFQDGRTLPIGTINVVVNQDISGGPYPGTYSWSAS